MTEIASSDTDDVSRELEPRDAAARLRSLIGKGSVAMVTATDRRFMPASRPLLTQQLDDDGVLWFFAPSDGSLALDIDCNPRVSATYGDAHRGIYVSLSGYARLVYDPDRIFSLWDERIETWFTQGPLDPRLALLRVDVDHAEYWDESARRRVRLLALAQAALKREPRVAEHGRMKLRTGAATHA
ncbi:MAG TPA: pyridoxamine 5'-phosphate oxidase family protein [Casimicrobiaceae bacterium]|nr:pyridoxamine 5'-phosphate oxidase family protein [Casimicrobiaceae bacterium]